MNDKVPPTKEEAQEIIRLAAAEGRVVFETEGTTHLCVCTKCGWEQHMTFFRREVNVSEDAGPCGECDEWAMTLKNEPDQPWHRNISSADGR